MAKKNKKRSLYSIRKEITELNAKIEELKKDLIDDPTSDFFVGVKIDKLEARKEYLNKLRKKITKRRKILSKLGLRNASFGGKN